MKTIFIILVFISTFLMNCSKNKNQKLSLISKDMLDSKFKKFLEDGNKDEALRFLTEEGEAVKDFVDPTGKTYPMVILDLFQGNKKDLYDLFDFSFKNISPENLNHTTTPEGNTLLHLALKNGHDLVIQDIINREGIKLNIFNLINQESPLCLAIKMGKKAIVEMFINREKAILGRQNTSSINIYNGFETLLNQEMNGDGDKPFMVAIKYNKFQILNYLWAQNESLHFNLVNYPNNKHIPPLVLAIDIRSKEIVKFLLEKGANPSLKVMNITPLTWAGYKKYEDIVEELLAAGGNFESRAHLNFKLIFKILGDVLAGLSITASEIGSFGAAEFNTGQVEDKINQHIKERHKMLLTKDELYEANKYIEIIYSKYNWITKVEGKKEIYEQALSEVIDFAFEESKEVEKLKNDIDTSSSTKKIEIQKLLDRVLQEQNNFKVYQGKVLTLMNTYPQIKELNSLDKKKHRLSGLIKKVVHHTSSEEGYLIKHYEIDETVEETLKQIYNSIIALIKERKVLLDILTEISVKAQNIKSK